MRLVRGFEKCVKRGWQTVRGGDGDLEAVAILPCVGGLACRDGGSPERALVVCRAGRIGTVEGVGIEGRIALRVDVERDAAGCVVTLRGTAVGVVACECEHP